MRSFCFEILKFFNFCASFEVIHWLSYIVYARAVAEKLKQKRHLDYNTKIDLYHLKSDSKLFHFDTAVSLVMT